MPKKKKGTFIVFYGVNNLGKSTQALMLVDQLKKDGKMAEYLKYPVYDLEPSGPIINSYLREGNPYNLTPTEVQTLYAFNRTQYEPQLVDKLIAGVTIVAEDYTGTGIAWGTGLGVHPELLRIINSHLIVEDVGLLFTGSRFAAGKEDNHVHEQDDDLTEKVDIIHKRLAKERGWHIIEANRSRMSIHEEIVQIVSKKT